MAQYIVEICPHEPRASICGMAGESVANDSHVAHCRASGNCEEACEYIRSLGVEFRIIARNESGAYENRLATDSELQATCEAIYFESESEFTDRGTCEVYLIWEAASQCEGESD